MEIKTVLEQTGGAATMLRVKEIFFANRTPRACNLYAFESLLGVAEFTPETVTPENGGAILI